MTSNVISGLTVALLQISSPAFKDNDFIPSKFTCEGESTSPELHVKNIPANAKTLAIILDDPDATHGTFVHWVAWNISPTETISEHTTSATMGNNGAGKKGYIGPCPPSGIHHYHFKIYALDTKLNLPEGSGKQELLDAMKGHIVGSGELIGLYKKVK